MLKQLDLNYYAISQMFKYLYYSHNEILTSENNEQGVGLLKNKISN